MPIVTGGLQHMLGLLIGEALTAFTNAVSALGVGNGTTAFSNAHTDLQGASKARKAMDATYPSRAGSAISVRSTFGTADANFAWEEVGFFNNTALATGVMFSRLVQALGTKANTATWQLTYTITPTVP